MNEPKIPPLPAKFDDHPDIMGGIRWSRIELQWIAARDYQWQEALQAAVRAEMVRISELERVLGLARDALSNVEPRFGYGFYRPANPNDFSPDHESCSPKEIAAHRAACEAYDKGEYTPEKGDGWVTPDVHLLKAPWGIGTYAYQEPAIAGAIAAIDAVMAKKEGV